MVVEIDRQAQARSLPVKLASLRFGKVIVWLPGSGPRIFRGFSRVRPARGNQTDFCARPADGLVLLAERVGHHQQHSGAIQSESDQRSSSSLCSSSNIDMALGLRKTVAARSNETPCSEGQLLKVVLELESLVDGHEDVNASAHRRNQDLIFVAGPSQVSDRVHRILRESSSQTRSQPWKDTLVDQDPTHSAIKSWASSRYSSTTCRETVGQPARKSSIVKPLLRSSSRRWTGTRVPRKQGAPCIKSGSTVTISLMRAFFSLLISIAIPFDAVEPVPVGEGDVFEALDGVEGEFEGVGDLLESLFRVAVHDLDALSEGFVAFGESVEAFVRGHGRRHPPFSKSHIVHCVSGCRARPPASP